MNPDTDDVQPTVAADAPHITGVFLDNLSPDVRIGTSIDAAMPELMQPLETVLRTASSLEYHPYHPKSHDVWPAEQAAAVLADYKLHGQRFPMRGVIDAVTGKILIHRDGGLLALAKKGDVKGELRVELWKLSDAEVVDDIMRENTRVVSLSYYERAVTYAAYVKAHGGRQRDCYATLNFGDESGLTKALSPVRLPEFLLDAIDDRTALQVSICAKINANLNDETRPAVEDMIAAGNGEKQPTVALMKTVLALLVPQITSELIGPDRRGSYSFTTSGEEGPVAKVRPVRNDRIEITLLNRLSRRDWAALGQAIAAI